MTSRNGINGVLVKNANRSHLFNFQANNNGGSGIQLQGAGVDTISNLTATNNRLYGILLLNSNRNQIFDFTASNNGASGVAFGCEINGTAPCPANRQPSTGNKVGIATIRTNGNVGILINLKSSRNQITITNDKGNQGAADLFDGNPDCDRNQWFNNIFGSASPASCIH